MSLRRTIGEVLCRETLILLFSRCFGVHASPVGSSPPAGPLGSTPSGPNTGSIPAGSSSSNNTVANVASTPSIRSIDTILAVLSVILITSTYAILIGSGTRLSSTSKLPLASIEANIGNLLSRAWVSKSDSADLESTSENCQENDAIRLLYVGKMDNEQERAGRGVEQCQALAAKEVARPPMWLTTGSSLTKSMVQLCVWEWISIWMVVGMVLATLSFNGFFANVRGPDANPRLVVVLLYLVSFCVHAWYVWQKSRSFFTLLGAGASWSLLDKAAFASVDLVQLKSRLLGGPNPVLRQVGKPAGSPVFPAYETKLLQDVGLPENTIPLPNPKLSDSRKGAIDTVSDWQKREINSVVESGKVALDRIVTNVMTIVGITITTGFSAWTSSTSSESSQLGSLALLASLTLGTGAMFSSAIELSIMNDSFRNVLFLKELMINGQAASHVEKRALKKTVIGFTHNTVKTRPVRMRELARYTGFWGLLLFGPGYSFLPSKEDHDRQATGAVFEFRVDVRGKSVILTTEETNRHNKREGDGNVEAINAFYSPEPSNTKPLVVLSHSENGDSSVPNLADSHTQDGVQQFTPAS
jgi:hypothetical protein